MSIIAFVGAVSFNLVLLRVRPSAAGHGSKSAKCLDAELEDKPPI
jgi:hypothetical protein